MKTTTKALLLILCAIALVAASVLGTLAYLSDRETVTNTFTVGNVDITVDEEEVNEDGTPTGNTERVTTNDYHLIPGQTYVKDPTMTVLKGSEESYVRMIVTLNCYDALQTIFDNQFLPQNFVEGWDGNVWVSTEKVEVSADGKSAAYEFRYHKTVDAYEAAADIVLEPLFTAFTMPGEVTKEELETLEGFRITVEGHAIQAATFEADDGKGLSAEDAAWAAFDAQNNS